MSQAESLDRDKVVSANWSLADWNAALIRQIFMRPDRTSTSLSRLDATGRLLQKIAGEVDGEVAKRRFIAAFGNDPARIKRQYRWSPSIPATTQRDGIPPTFAALYLTLLAASADDTTFEDGNFRNRFSRLLNSPGLASFEFGELPRLWLHFAEWTRSRQQSMRDCARLLLPDPPQHEKLIGRSKRLAFPTYRDELQLRATLKKSGLDSDASFASVSAVVHERLTSFSSDFREELTTFHQFVARGRRLEAYESPFWGAIRDIRQETDEKRVEDYGRFCVLLDASDPRHLEFFLLSDDRGFQSLAEGERIVLERPQESYSLMWRDPARTTAIDAIAALAARHRDLARSRVGTALLAGCLMLLPDSVGRLTTDGDYYDNGPVALVSCREHSDRFIATCRHLGVRWHGASAHDANGEWRAMVFPSISRASLDRLSALMPEGAKGLARIGWRPPRPRLSGGAWFGQALLLSPASNPVVHMENCEAGRFALLGETGEEIGVGTLVMTGDELYIPPAMLTETRRITACRYVLELGAEGESVLEVPVVTEIPRLDYRQIGDRGVWLSDGPNGSLSGLELVPPLPVSTVDPARQRPLTGGWPLLKPTSTTSLTACAPMEQSQPPQPFGWLTEMLALRYARRTSLPFSELRSHLDMVAAATNISPWVVRRLLLAGCWLRTAERRTSPFPTLILADRMISCRSLNGRSVARISGMFQEAELRDLQQALYPTESISRISTDDLQAVIGCLEISFDSMDRARELANRHNLTWIEQETPWNPMAGMLLPTSEIRCHQVMQPNLLLEEWDAKARLWLEARIVTEEPVLGALFKAQGNQRNTFWIKSKDGFFATDSSSWAWLVHTLEIEGSLGSLLANGDVAWSERIMSLPSTLCRWWLHLGGGCIGIGPQGALVFLGGGTRSIWEGVASSTPDHPTATARCLERRTLALRIRQRRTS